MKLRKKCLPLKLKDQSVYIDVRDDSGNFYYRIENFNWKLYSGKNSFLVNPINDYFQTRSEIKIEALDSEGNNLFVEFPRNPDSPEYKYGYREGNGKRISITLHENASHGYGEIIFLAKLANYIDNGIKRPIPDEWKNRYNFRWIKKILIDPDSENASPIRFYRDLNIEVNEIFSRVLEVSSPTMSFYSSSFSGEICYYYKNRNNSIYGFNEIEYHDIFRRDGSPSPKSMIIRDYKTNFSEDDFSIRDVRTGGGESDIRGVLTSRLTLINPNDNIYELYFPLYDFKPYHLGATIRMNSISVPNGLYSSDILSRFPLSSYKLQAKIVGVIDSHNVEIDKPIRVYSSDGSEYFEYDKCICTDFRIDFTLPASKRVTDRFISMADIRINNLRTFSGKVDRIKIYYKSQGVRNDTDYQFLSDIKVSPTNIFFHVAESDYLSRTFRVGIFDDLSVLQNYWRTSSLKLKDENSVLKNVSLTLTNWPRINSVNIDFGIDDFNSYNRINIFEYKLDNIKFSKGNEYAIEFNVLCNSSKSIHDVCEVDLFMKGTAFVSSDSIYETDYPEIASELGKFIGRIKAKNTNGKFVQAGNSVRKTYNFIADHDGYGKIVFASRNGIINLSDIKIYSATETGFNPDEFFVAIPLKSNIRNEKITFKIECFSPLGEKHFKDFYSKPFFFKGENSYIYGEDNLLSGSLMIGNVLGSGIEMYGGNSAYIKSMGWRGWDYAVSGSGSGFMIWSGSVTPWKSNLFASEADIPSSMKNTSSYGDVGIELLGTSSLYGISYLRFRTQPKPNEPNLDIRGSIRATEGGIERVFYVGTGSNKIHISSSTNIVDGATTFNNVSIISSVNFNPNNPRDQGWAILGNGYAFFNQVSVSGSMTVNTGSIGGWEITQNSIRSTLTRPTRIHLFSSDPHNSFNSTIKIGISSSLGGNPEFMTFNSITGIYMDGSGSFRAGNPNGTRISVSPDGNLVISSSRFDFRTPNLVITNVVSDFSGTEYDGNETSFSGHEPSIIQIEPSKIIGNRIYSIYSSNAKFEKDLNPSYLNSYYYDFGIFRNEGSNAVPPPLD